MKRVMKLIKNSFNGKYEPQEVTEINLRQEVLDLEEGPYTFSKDGASHLIFVHDRPNSKLYCFGGLGMYINMDGSLSMLVMDGARLNENFAVNRPIIENLYNILSTYEYKRV